MSSPSERAATPPSSPPADAAGPTSRRFTLGDAVVLIAVFAVYCAERTPHVGLSRIPSYLSQAPTVFRYLYLGGPSARSGYSSTYPRFLWETPITIYMEVVMPLIALGTPAVFLLRLRTPRPPWRSLLRQPGFVACLSVLVAFWIGVDLTWLGVLLPESLSVGVAVAVAWVVLFASRRWQSERSWIDRAGRMVGVGWIAWAAMCPVQW